MSSSIHFQASSRCFVLTLKSSVYVFRILESGELVHVFAGPTAVDQETLKPDHLAEYGDSNYVWEQQARAWEICTFGDLNYHDSAIKLSILDPLAPAGVIRDLRLRYVDHNLVKDAKPGLSPKTSPERETLAVRLRDGHVGIDVTLYYRVTPEHDVIERWLEISNHTEGAVTVESLSFATIHVPNGEYELTRTAGTWAREFIPQRQLLSPGRTVMESLGLNTGHATNPFFILNAVGEATETAGTVYFGALAYSGNWRLSFEVLPTTATRIHGGYDPGDFQLILLPGEAHTTPALIFGSCGEGIGGASRRLHRFARETVLPSPRHGDDRPVLYNSWEAVYFEMSLESQMELARKAAAIGIELFCVDDGWFGGRRNDSAGLGDWWVSPDLFPDGITPLIDEVKRLGMRFGIWVEPEMVNPDSDLYRAHPDWVLHYPGRPRTEVRQQLILDFGRPEVVEFIWNSLDTLLAKHDISFFKWDMNRYVTEPGSVAGQAIWYKHVQALYGLMDRLRAAYPKLEIQSCSGGGGRIDFGILGRTDQAWTSDNTDAIDRVSIQDGYSYAYPPCAMEAWVTHEVNHQTGRRTSLDLRFDVAMRGALGIGTSLNKLSDTELEDYTRKIAFYKRIRGVVQHGDLYRLVSRTNESVWFTVSKDQTQAVFSIVVTGEFRGICHAPIKLPGLQLGQSYSITDETGSILGTWMGAQLSTIGLPIDHRYANAHGAVFSKTLFVQAMV